MSLRRTRRALLLATILLTGAKVPPAFGHGLALPFAFWGHFQFPGAAYCQRVIGAEAAQCGERMWKVHTDCFNALISGKPCEVTSVPLEVQQAHLDALNVVDLQCTSPEAQAVGFLLKFEAQTDLDNFCRVLEDELISAVYGPVLVGDVVRVPDPTTRDCIEATERASTRLLQFAFRARRQTLDSIAARDLSPGEKQFLVDRSSVEIARLRLRLEQDLETVCPPASFSAVYGRSDDALLQMIGTRADCLSSGVYVQNGVLCPTAVCGNGMKEPGEQCDDGNLVGGDGCSSRCIVETPTPGP